MNENEYNKKDIPLNPKAKNLSRAGAEKFIEISNKFFCGEISVDDLPKPAPDFYPEPSDLEKILDGEFEKIETLASVDYENEIAEPTIEPTTELTKTDDKNFETDNEPPPKYELQQMTKKILKRSDKHQVHFYLSADEYEVFIALQTYSGLSKKEFLRRRIFDKPIYNTDGLLKLTKELQPIGNNLNQIARNFNEGDYSDVNVQRAIEEVTALWQLLKRFKAEYHSET